MTAGKMIVVASPGLDGEILAVHRGDYTDEMVAEYQAREFDVLELDDAEIDWATTRLIDGKLVTVDG